MNLAQQPNPFEAFDVPTAPAETPPTENLFSQFDVKPEEAIEPEPYAISDTPLGDLLDSTLTLPSDVANIVTEGAKGYTTQAIPGDVGTGNPVTAVANLARPVLDSINRVGETGVDAWMATYGQIPGVSSALEKIANSDLAVRGIELAAKAGKAWDGFSKTHPVEAAIIKDAGVAAEIVPAGKAPKLLAKQGKRMTTAGNLQQLEERRAGITDLILPESKVGGGFTEEVGSTPLNRQTVLTPDGQEDTIIKVLETLDTVDPDRSLAYNLGKVDVGITDLARETEKMLKGSRNKKIDFNNLQDTLEAAVEDITEIPGYHALRGDAQKIAEDYLKEAKRILSEADKTPIGLLQARRDFDDIVNQGGDIFGTPSYTAKKVAATHIRTEMNSHLMRAVGEPEGGALYDLLNRQHNLIRGKEIIKGKTQTEANSSIARVLKTLQSHGLVGTTALSGIAAITAFGSAPAALGVLGAGAAGYGALKVFQGMKGPKVKRTLGAILKAGSKVIDQPDRLLIMELMKLSNEELEGVVNDGTGT